jgi:hypothetical protein
VKNVRIKDVSHEFSSSHSAVAEAGGAYQPQPRSSTSKWIRPQPRGLLVADGAASIHAHVSIADGLGRIATVLWTA